ncbi:hypothetical protein [Falsirhodobacter xinxiangensis]|uniref:hypothetical protein n=1 Tax=Falsirhodobacter xinxiangensis TaxID=2530049 RepID=UPI0010A9F48F|nr:hypothetical protein [Rhodobacter xinxiangensis]
MIARVALTALLALSLCATLLTGVRIMRDPTLRPFIDRGAQEIEAAVEAEMARTAPETIAARLDALLAEDPRNWVAIDAVAEVAAERGLPVPDLPRPGFLENAADCAACAYDPAACTLSPVLICQAPVALTSLGDIAGLARGGQAYVTGAEVDTLDVTLSAIGLGATVFVVASGGSSAVVKLGAAMTGIARKMRLLSPRLTATLTRAAREGIDWARLPAVRGTDDLAALMRPAVLAPVADIARGAGRIGTALPPAQALHLMRHIDTPADARRIANASEALGPRTVGRMEVLGKARFLRATWRVSNVAWSLLAGIMGFAMALAGMVGNAVQSWALRRLSRS